MKVGILYRGQTLPMKQSSFWRQYKHNYSPSDALPTIIDELPVEGQVVFVPVETPEQRMQGLALRGARG